MRRDSTATAPKDLAQRLRRMNLQLEELLALGVPDGITTRQRVEAMLVCSRAIARLDDLAAALDRSQSRRGAPPAARSGKRVQSERAATVSGRRAEPEPPRGPMIVPGARRSRSSGRPNRTEVDAMARFSVNPRRLDPYKNFKFRVFWAGATTPVAGANKMSALKRTTEAVKRRSGVGRKPPGRTEYAAITLEQGITHDREFEKWARQVWYYGSGRGTGDTLKDSRRNLVIEVLNEAGQPALRYRVLRCWVSEFQALTDLDANANAVAIQHMKIENEGWERDEVDPPRTSRTRPPRPRHPG